jgi:alpha-mannosidase
VTIRMGQMEEFAEAIIKSGAKLPVVTKEAPDTWIHGVMSDPGGIKLYRHLQPLASSAEVLNTQLQLSKVPAENATHLFDEANEQRLLYAEHTWGVGQGVRVYGKEFHDQPAGTYKNLEGSWEDKTNYIRRADTLIRSQLASDLTSLAKAIDCEGKRFVVYNPLPWKRSEMIEIPGTGGMNYFAEDVPGNGYKCFSFAKVRSSATENATSDSIENAYYKISFDPDRGTIKSLVNKKTGKDWISTDVTEGLGHYVNERFTFEQCLDYTKKYQNERAMGCLGMAEDEDWPHPGINKPGMISEKGVPYRIASPHRGTVTITRTNGAQTAVLTMKAEPDRFLPASELRVRLESGMPYVEITCKIIDKPKDNWPEADWLCLPFNIKNPTFSIARALGTINPARDLLPGSNRHLYSVGSGVTITDSDGSGVAVCPIDHPLVSLGEPGMWQFSRDYCPVQSTVYVNLYNNMWNTNFRYWYPGTWESRVRIWTFEKQSHAEKRFQIAGLEARNPLLVAVADGDGGHMPMQKPGIVASRKGITITALRAPLSLQGKTGDNVLFRIWERAGQAGELTISFPPEMKYSQASPVNLRGEPAGDSLPIKHGTLFIQIGKYAPASFILKGLSQ